MSFGTRCPIPPNDRYSRWPIAAGFTTKRIWRMRRRLDKPEPLGRCGCGQRRRKEKVRMDLDAIDSRNAALLIVNMQNGLVQQKGAPGLPAALSAMKRLIERCVQAGLPVIWTLQEDFAVATSRARKQPASHPARRRRISCLAGSWEAELIDELRPLAAANPAYVLRERGLGAFYETGLEALLRQLGTRCLV